MYISIPYSQHDSVNNSGQNGYFGYTKRKVTVDSGLLVDVVDESMSRIIERLPSKGIEEVVADYGVRESECAPGKSEWHEEG